MSAARKLWVGAGVGLTAMALLMPERVSAAPIVGTALVVEPGSREVSLASGGRGTAFALALPHNAGCRGDSADDGYRVQSYMVPASVDPASLTFGSVGPLPRATGNVFRQPLYGVTSSPYVNEQTANVDVPGDIAAVISIPAFSLAVFSDDELPAGAYNVGVACTKGPAASTQIDRLWNAQLTVAAARSGTGLTWTAPSANAPASRAVSQSDLTSVTSSGAVGQSERATPEARSDATAGESSVAGRDPAPTGGPPNFSVPAVALVQWPRVGVGSGLSMAVWFVALSALVRISLSLVRKAQLRPASVL